MIALIFIAIICQIEVNGCHKIIDFQEPCKLVWEPDMSLEWSNYQSLSNDYTCNLDDNNGHSSAVSHINTEVTYFFDEDDGKTNLVVSVKAVFDCDKSWAVTRSDQLLEHEQLHFDISELYARKLRKALSKKKLHKKSYLKEVNKIKEKMWSALDETQTQFDQETDFSRNARNQAAWRQQINSELKKLEKYQNDKVVLKLKI